jgi:hypothetical protein
MDRDDTEFLQVALKKLSLLTRLKVAESSKAVSVRSDSTGVAYIPLPLDGLKRNKQLRVFLGRHHFGAF